mgnify:CR=1 FL=1
MANAVRKTLNYLGLVDDEPHYEEEYSEYVTPARKMSRRIKATAAHTFDTNQIVTIHPKQYSDAKSIADNFSHDIPVIVNFSQMTVKEAKRLIDFCSGLIMGRQGRIEKITNKVFLLSPYNIMVTGENPPEDTGTIDMQFFNQ